MRIPHAVLLFMVLPASAPAAVTIKAIAANGDHSLALDSDGMVWEWGGKSSAPTRVSGLTGVVSVAAGFDYGLAVRNDGTVWAWGANHVGQLGDGTTTSRPTPVQVTGLTDVIGVSAGHDIWSYRSGGLPYSVAVRRDGTLWVWGPRWAQDGSLRLGEPPTQGTAISGIVAVEDGVALKADGTVWFWALSGGPTQLKGLAGIVAVAGGLGLALKDDGTVWNWRGSEGQRVNGIDGVAAISGGPFHYLALKRDGTVWSWSARSFFSNVVYEFGQLGDGTTENQTTPGQVSGLTDVVSVAAGGRHSLALKSDGTVWAWGLDSEGQLGDGRPTRRSVAGEVNALHEVAAISTGAEADWALKRDGSVWAWGKTSDYDPCRPIPESLVRGMNGGVAIAGNVVLNVVLKEDGTLWTWRPWWWQYGIYADQPPKQPVQVSGIDGAVAIANGLALKGDGSVWRLSIPPARAETLERIVGIAAGGLANLAVAEDGTVWEWVPGMLSFDPTRLTAQVSELDRIVGVAAGSAYSSWTCPWWTLPDTPPPCPAPVDPRVYSQALAVTPDGRVWGWTRSEPLPLRYPEDWISPPISRTTPVQVSGLAGIVRVVAGERHNLALKTDGTVWAWGQNDSGQLGDGTTTTRTAPVRVPGLTGVVAIAASTTHSVALRNDGTVWAWGQNDSGQLGDGRAIIQTTPIQVIQPGSPDLTVEMSHKGEFAVGGQGVYELTVTNVGLTATTGPISITDALPPGLTYVSGTGPGWTCSAADQVVSCTNPGPMDPRASSSIALTVRLEPTAYPAVTNLATVSNESDRNVANDTIGDPTAVSAGK